MNEQETHKQDITEGGCNNQLVRRCSNCIHSSKGFKVAGNTHHHCLHPSIATEIKDPCGWDTLVTWHFKCDNWSPNPNNKARSTKHKPRA